MKQRLFGITIIGAIFFSGCTSRMDNSDFDSSIRHVTDIMQSENVVGWSTLQDDSDLDNVPDLKDKCPNTIPEARGFVDSNGCALDSDKDGVLDYKDNCPNTPIGVKVNENGCGIDSDKDGIADYRDKCPNTPIGMSVDSMGCVLDTDKDGIPNVDDKCPNTPFGAVVNPSGCSIDEDKDGVIDGLDKCPNTPADAKVDFKGCPVIAEYRFHFKTNSYKIDKEYYPQIEQLANTMRLNPSLQIEIEGFTDNQGDYLYNKELSLKRANALRVILITKYNIDPNRITIIGYGSDHNIWPNDTDEHRYLNRRIVVVDKSSMIFDKPKNIVQDVNVEDRDDTQDRMDDDTQNNQLQNQGQTNQNLSEQNNNQQSDGEDIPTLRIDE